MRNKWLSGSIVAGVLIAVILSVVSFRGGKSAERADLASIPVNGKVIGAATAPVLLEVFSDYQCPWCARSAKSFEQDIISGYVSKGQVRLQFRDYPFVGLESYWAAVAAGCAQKQGKFWEYHDRLFAEQKGENQGRFNRDNLQLWAKDLGLDTAAFGRCVTQEESAGPVRDDYQLGRSRGVNSTPTYFVNGQKIEGIPTASELDRIVSKELAKEK
jgi:protein-disulfide isomerase